MPSVPGFPFPVSITALVAPVCKSNTLTVLGVLRPLAGTQGVLKTGPSAAQTSVFRSFSMTITPFGPEYVFLIGGTVQSPTNGGGWQHSLVPECSLHFPR